MNSAYKLALSMNTSLAMAEPSNGDTHKLFWHTIWGLRVPNKVKTFTWKACRNILPTTDNLCHRHILTDPTCEACHLAGHLFWECTKAKETWSILGIPFDKTGVSHRTFVNFLWYLIFIQHFSHELLELTVMIS